MVTAASSAARVAAFLAAVESALSCKPDLNDTVSIVTTPQILAVQSVPAEAAPGKTTQLIALYAGPSGPIDTGAVDWAFCDERKPLAELEPVSPMCLQPSGDWFVPIGDGDTVVGTIPSDACRQFGPDVPQPQPNQPPGRPVDPDPTGGYYQPVRVLAAGAEGNVVGIGEMRLTCALANASADVVAAFAQRYHPNANPAVASFGPKGTVPWIPSDQGSNAVSPGQRIELEVAWPVCPAVDSCGDGICGPEETQLACASCGSSVVCPADCTTPVGCGGAERYVALDPATGALVDRREGMSVAWYATGGSFDVDRTGRDGSDTTASSDDFWVAPSARQIAVTLWVVLRDERGGTTWSQYSVSVL